MPPQNPIPGGYFLLARKVIESELFTKPPHYLKLWVWMLARAFWRDGEKVKRGQIFTTIEEMRNVGLYKSGGRLQGKFTEDQVRSAYNFFQDSGSIMVSKATRGMFITIINYDTYQNPESYGPHTGPGAVPDPTRFSSEMSVNVSEIQDSATSGPHSPAGTAPSTVNQPGPAIGPDPTHRPSQTVVSTSKIRETTTPGPRTDSGTAPDPTLNPTPEPTHNPSQMPINVNFFDKSDGSDPTPEPTPEPLRTPHYKRIHNNIKTSCASPTSKRPPSGDFQSFLTWWSYAYERTQGKPYLTSGKDFKHIKKLLATHGLKPLIIMASWFLTHQDDWLASKRDLPMLLSQINRIPGHKDERHTAPAYRAAGILPPEGMKFEDWRFWEQGAESLEVTHA